MREFIVKVTASVFLLLLPLLTATLPVEAGDVGSAPTDTPTEGVPDFTNGVIPALHIVSDGHISTTKNDVKYDVYFDNGVKNNVVIYTINTGRKQLVLTPEKHEAILEDLLKRKFTVIVADLRNKKLPGIELEHYICQLTNDAKEAADGVLHPTVVLRPPLAASKPAKSSTDTYANDYFTVMPGFTVKRDVVWFRYSDIPVAFRKAIAGQLDKPFREEDGDKVDTFDIIYPAYGPTVGVLTNYCSVETGHQDYYPLPTMNLVMAFAFKNVAIVSQQYFNDPVGGYHKGYDYYGDQFAASFIRYLKGNAGQYHIDLQKICCFGCSKGSEVPGMLVNKLRGEPQYLYSKALAKKIPLSDKEMMFASPYYGQSTEIACAILGAGIANGEMASDVMMPWKNNPAQNISPFFLYADHRTPMRNATSKTVAIAKTNGVDVETAQLGAHAWPYGEAYDSASAFFDRIIRPEY